MDQQPILKPTKDWIIVTPFEAVEEEGGIVSAKSQVVARKGIIIAVGPGTADMPMYFKQDDTVYFGAFSCHNIKFRGQDLTIVKQSDILAGL